MAYDILLTDIDNTLLDFTAASRAALDDVLKALGIPPAECWHEKYETINLALWEAFERGELEKSQIFTTRFARFLEVLGISGQPEAVNDQYMEALRARVFWMPHGKELLEALRGKVRIYAVTNGDGLTQRVRLRDSGLDQYLDGIFISEEMGCKKPEKQFFDLVFQAIGPVDRKKCLLLGDSLTSDMAGGRAAGIDTCLLGQAHGDPRCDYVISDLLDILPLMGGKETQA